MILGIDIGGSKIRSIVWNGRKVSKSHEIHTPKNLKEFTKIISGVINNSFPKQIGIGIAGVIKNNKVISATNIKYLKNYNFPKNYKIDNDARCFARAEYKLGAGKGAQSVLVFTIGTGIGRAYGKNGKILKIKRFEKEESWEKEYQKIYKTKAIAEFLTLRLFKIIKAYKPEVVILGGGVIEKKAYFKAIKQKMSEARFRTLGFTLHRAKLGKFSGAIGAALQMDK
ncbi:MAG: ROK family protein [Patescibacteria group bacterium]